MKTSAGAGHSEDWKERGGRKRRAGGQHKRNIEREKERK